MSLRAKLAPRHSLTPTRRLPSTFMQNICAYRTLFLAKKIVPATASRVHCCRAEHCTSHTDALDIQLFCILPFAIKANDDGLPSSFINHAVGGTRTPNLQVRSLLLYPIELRPHVRNAVFPGDPRKYVNPAMFPARRKPNRDARLFGLRAKPEVCSRRTEMQFGLCVCSD